MKQKCKSWQVASGQIPINPTNGEIEAEGIETRTIQVMKNIGAVLEEAVIGYLG